MKEYDRLSKRQKAILRFIKKHLDMNGFPPTIREIGIATSIDSTSVVNYNLNKLVKAGFLERSEHVSRGLRLIRDLPGEATKKLKEYIAGPRIPVVGQIVASEPVEIPDGASHYYDEDSLIDFPAILLGKADPDEVFALKVKGDSMIDAMVQDGDIVLFLRQNTARNGEMVAVWLPDRNETTLKHFYNEGKQIRLQPAHPTMPAIYVDPKNCQIQGKVLSVIRHVD